LHADILLLLWIFAKRFFSPPSRDLFINTRDVLSGTFILSPPPIAGLNNRYISSNDTFIQFFAPFILFNGTVDEQFDSVGG